MWKRRDLSQLKVVHLLLDIIYLPPHHGVKGRMLCTYDILEWFDLFATLSYTSPGAKKLSVKF